VGAILTEGCRGARHLPRFRRRRHYGSKYIPALSLQLPKARLSPKIKEKRKSDSNIEPQDARVVEQRGPFRAAASAKGTLFCYSPDTRGKFDSQEEQIGLSRGSKAKKEIRYQPSCRAVKSCIRIEGRIEGEGNGSEVNGRT